MFRDINNSQKYYRFLVANAMINGSASDCPQSIPMMFNVIVNVNKCTVLMSDFRQMVLCSLHYGSLP